MTHVCIKKTKTNCTCGFFPGQYRGEAAATCWDFVGLPLQTQQDVLRLDVRVDDFTLSVKVVQTLKNLEKTQKHADVSFHTTSTQPLLTYGSIRANWWLGEMRIT